MDKSSYETSAVAYLRAKDVSMLKAQNLILYKLCLLITAAVWWLHSHNKQNMLHSMPTKAGSASSLC